MNWKSSIKDFEKYLIEEKSLSSNTIQAYVNDVNKLESFISESFQSIAPEKVKKIHLEEFLNKLEIKGVRFSTQSRIISGIRSYFTFLMINEKIKSDPTALLQTPKVVRESPEILAPEEIDHVIESLDPNKPDGIRSRAIIECLYGCGLTVSELLSLKICDINFELGTLLVRKKNGNERVIPITKITLCEILKYINGPRNKLQIHLNYLDVLFLNRRGRGLSWVMIYTILKTAAQKVGINRPISPQTFRHSYAMNLINAGTDMGVLKELMGHESILTTEIYSLYKDQDLLPHNQ